VLVLVLVTFLLPLVLVLLPLVLVLAVLWRSLQAPHQWLPLPRQRLPRIGPAAAVGCQPPWTTSRSRPETAPRLWPRLCAL
jgi:hypothetical protein